MATDLVTVYLGLGSNMGDRKSNLDDALGFLSQRLRIKQVSSVYDTEPVGDADQPHFLNLVCEAETGLSPTELLALAKAIETKLGRVRIRFNAPRPIDIDILFYSDMIIDLPELTVPHPRLTERAFVLTPLDEIAPDLAHPANGKTVRELNKAITEIQGVFRWENI